MQAFQASGSSVQVFLLTSQVGGLGLTLTAATRVLILDPHWNPRCGMLIHMACVAGAGHSL